MLGKSVKQVSRLLTIQKRFLRVPSIKFTHGARSEINKAMLTQEKPSWFVVHSAAPSMPVAEVVTGPRVGKTVVVGGKSTTTVHMASDFMGNPFNPTVPSLSFDDITMAMIELGGAMPDVPKPAKDDKKKK